MATRAGPTADLAVVDLSRNDREVANELLLAASTFGFVYVKNNEAGIMPADLTEIFQMVTRYYRKCDKYSAHTVQKSRKFFKSPTLEKEECSVHSSKSGKNQGWLSMHTENLDPEKQKVLDARNTQQPPLKTHPTSGKSNSLLCNRLLEKDIARSFTFTDMS